MIRSCTSGRRLSSSEQQPIRATCLADGYIYVLHRRLLSASSWPIWGCPPEPRSGRSARTSTTPLPASRPYDLDAVKLAVESIGPGSFRSTVLRWTTTIGYDVSCSNSSYIVPRHGGHRRRRSQRDVVHRLKVEMTETARAVSVSAGYGSSGGAQVSPAPAAASFGDVPPSHPFFQFIEALTASGITAGCGSELLPRRPVDARPDGGVPLQGARPALVQLIEVCAGESTGRSAGRPVRKARGPGGVDGEERASCPGYGRRARL